MKIVLSWMHFNFHDKSEHDQVISVCIFTHMIRNSYTSQMLIAHILKGDAERDNALRYLYKKRSNKNLVRKVVLDGGGDAKLVDLIFRNCLVAIDKLIRRNYWRGETEFEELLNKIAKKLWAIELGKNVEARNRLFAEISTDTILKRKIFSNIVKNSGKQEDAEDFYQNGMILLNQNIEKRNYRGGNIRGYFYQLCFNLWRNKLKKKKTVSSEGGDVEAEGYEKDPLFILEEKEFTQELSNIFAKIDEPCRKIIHLKYLVIDRFSMDEIAYKMSLKNGQNASNMLSKCRKKLWSLIQENEIIRQWNKIPQIG